MPSPLAGRRILITRPKHQATTTALTLRALGAVPISIPLITLGPPPDLARVAEAVRVLADYDLVAFTSANAVRFFLEALLGQGHDVSRLRASRIAAIGEGTASALDHAGVCAEIIPAVFVGEALAQAILEDPILRNLLPQRAPRVLILRALVAREVLPQSLRAAGYLVDTVAVYETRPTPSTHAEELISRLEAHVLDDLLLTASSAATRLANLLGSRATSLLQGVTLASIGPITTATLENRGLAVQVTATEQTLEGVISALETYHRQKHADHYGQQRPVANRSVSRS